MNTKLLVSIVITTKNEEKNISKCLESIQYQTWKYIEIIVIDNASTDQTKNIAKNYTDNVFDWGPERSAQRNYGMISVARGDYVMYVDADMLLSPGLIEACIKYISTNDAIALHIPEIVLGKSYFSRVRRFERSFYDGTVIDGARFFRRDAFIRVGGFDEKLFIKGSGEDWDIDKKIKKIGKIALLRNELYRNPILKKWPLDSFISNRGVSYDVNYMGIYHNESEFKLFHYLKKKYYYTQGFDGYIEKWGKSDLDIKKQFGIYYRYLQVFTENGKWKIALSAPLLFAGVFFIRILVGITFILRKMKA